jgi:hypothetical protein
MFFENHIAIGFWLPQINQLAVAPPLSLFQCILVRRQILFGVHNGFLSSNMNREQRAIRKGGEGREVVDAARLELATSAV